MWQKKYLLVFLLLKASPLLCHCIEHEGGFWTDLTIFGQFWESKHLDYLFEVHTRCRSGKTYYDQNVIRFGLGGYPGKNCSVWAGYGFSPSRDDLDNTIAKEHRFWTHFIFFLEQEKYSIIFRSRIEERLRHKKPNVAFLFRQKAILEIYEIFKNINLVFADELYINLNPPYWMNSKGVNQNRIFAGLEFVLKENCSLTTGYLNQTIPVENKTFMTHIFSITLSVRY